MPQANSTLREAIEKHFGSLDAGPPLQYLIDAGWTEKNGELFEPKGKKWSQCASFERMCVLFLVEEFDFC